MLSRRALAENATLTPAASIGRAAAAKHQRRFQAASSPMSAMDSGARVVLGRLSTLLTRPRTAGGVRVWMNVGSATSVE